MNSASKSKMDFNKLYFRRHYTSFEERNPTYKLKSYLRVVRKWTKDFEGRPVLLDIGCGFGRFLKIAEPFFETHGIDPSKFAIGQAHQYAKRSAFTISTLESYNTRIRFDIITAFDVLEHTQNVLDSLKKVSRLLRPGGIFICVVPVYDGPLGIIGGVLDHDLTHVQKLSRWQWLELFKSQFEIVEMQGAIRYSFSGGIYFHMLSPFFWKWGQAILVVLQKYDNR